MINFDTALKLGEEVLTSLENLYQLVYPPTVNGAKANGCGPIVQSPSLPVTYTSLGGTVDLPNLLQFRRKLLALHAKRHLVTELTATGKLSENEAQAMVDQGSTQSNATPRASGTAFANILAWLQANGPTIAQDIAAAIPIIISLITLFGG
ncbi:MAG TPA: hypothetical protein VG097_17300 [Gemmata sp.]|jgi:hypothetical protein|nr:hypothetical protein [Gemmata sp.]